MASYDPGSWDRGGWGPEFDHIQRGGLPKSTEARLKELVGWGGSTSFMSSGDLAVAADAGIHPIGQVVGLSAGHLRHGHVRTTRPGQGRMRIGVARWRELTGPVLSWATLRQRALARLVKQCELLSADAVIEIRAVRELEQSGEEVTGQVRFTGTAVRVDQWRSRRGQPVVLTLASAAEVWAMFRSGIEPAGIAGGFASIQTLPSKQTVAAVLGTRRRRVPNMELADLTEGVYEARRLAIHRLLLEAKALNADGLVGIELELDEPEPENLRVTGFSTSVHVLASAVRRTGDRAARLCPSPVVSLSRPAYE